MTYDRRRATLLFAALLTALLSVALGGLVALDVAPWPTREGTASIDRSWSTGAVPKTADKPD
jgi:hypothetical protein